MEKANENTASIATFAAYLLACFKWGSEGNFEPAPPMPLGGHEIADPGVAAEALGALLAPYGVANQIKAAVVKGLLNSERKS